jgi:hypothetical protein
MGSSAYGGSAARVRPGQNPVEKGARKRRWWRAEEGHRGVRLGRPSLSDERSVVEVDRHCMPMFWLGLRPVTLKAMELVPTRLESESRPPGTEECGRDTERSLVEIERLGADSENRVPVAQSRLRRWCAWRRVRAPRCIGRNLSIFFSGVM